MKKINFKKLILLSFILTVISSCKEDKEEEFNLDTGLSFYIFDENGNDLLNPNEKYPKSINTNFIEKIDLIDGKEVVFYNGLLEYPRGYGLIKPELDETKYQLGISLNSKTEKRKTGDAVTYIKWNKDDTDTIKARIDKGKGYEICTSVDLNGKNVWDVKKENAHPTRLITIIK